MDLRLLLNPMPEAEAPQITTPPNNAVLALVGPGTPPPEQAQAHSIGPCLHSRFLLSPRRGLDSETASVSSTSSTKRRRTNRGGGKVEVRNAPHMARTFSEIEVPSEDSSNEDQDAVKRGVAQLSLSGDLPGRAIADREDEYGDLRLGTRVEALKAGTQGTWYVARIVEFASFPVHYIDGFEDIETPQAEYLMVCVHYEGTFPKTAASEPETDYQDFPH